MSYNIYLPRKNQEIDFMKGHLWVKNKWKNPRLFEKAFGDFHHHAWLILDRGLFLISTSLYKQSFLDFCSAVDGKLQHSILPQTDFSPGYNPSLGKTSLAFPSYQKQTSTDWRKWECLDTRWQMFETGCSAVFSLRHIPCSMMCIHWKKIISILNSSLSKAKFQAFTLLLFSCMFSG